MKRSSNLPSIQGEKPSKASVTPQSSFHQATNQNNCLRTSHLPQIVEEASPYKGAFFQHKPLGGHREGHWELHPNAETLTVLCGRENTRYGPGAFTFSNHLGGRILGIPLFPSVLGHNPFLNHYRIESLQRWITAAAIRFNEKFCFSEGNPNVLPIHANYGDHEVILCLNLCTQSMMDVAINCFDSAVPTKAFTWDETRVEPLEFSIEPATASFRIKTTTPIRPLACCIFVS